ncbi:CsbD family protein [Nocardia sp. 2YAB30]|uniref:microaggregate-binding protein 1 n=1 Tax=unclassified Nocardia TaxID=2637762 RepID=UPI003F9AC2AC
MPEHQSGPREAVEGVVEDIKGKTKEAAGVVTGDEDLKKEGRAQQDKAESQRDAAQKEAEAEKARGEAKLDEARQSAHQSGKDV